MYRFASVGKMFKFSNISMIKKERKAKLKTLKNKRGGINEIYSLKYNKYRQK